jgi:hypothetical protein
MKDSERKLFEKYRDGYYSMRSRVKKLESDLRSEVTKLVEAERRENAELRKIIRGHKTMENVFRDNEECSHPPRSVYLHNGYRCLLCGKEVQVFFRTLK